MGEVNEGAQSWSTGLEEEHGREETKAPLCLRHHHQHMQVTAVSGAADATKSEKAAQLRFEGRGFAQALEAVERELA